MIDVNVGVEEFIYIFNMNCDKRKFFGNYSGNFLLKRKWYVVICWRFFVRKFFKYCNLFENDLN